MTNGRNRARSVDDLDEGAANEEREASSGGAGAVDEEDPMQGSPELAAEHAAEEELRNQMDSLQSEFVTLNDRHLRLAAEFQNYRRRAESEMTETWGRAQADFVRRFLDVLDDLQRVSRLDPESASVESIVEGVDLVERKFLRALKDAGVEVVDPTGLAFDPTTMEAVMRATAETPEEDDCVDRVFQNGYTMKGHLIRPARVSVKKFE